LRQKTAESLAVGVFSFEVKGKVVAVYMHTFILGFSFTLINSLESWIDIVSKGKYRIGREPDCG
jgi:hypothetical protein